MFQVARERNQNLYPDIFGEPGSPGFHMHGLIPQTKENKELAVKALDPTNTEEIRFLGRMQQLRIMDALPLIRLQSSQTASNLNLCCQRN